MLLRPTANHPVAQPLAANRTVYCVMLLLAALPFVLLWFGLPLRRRAKLDRSR